MKVDQYRVLKAKEYSFLVPAGMDLGDFDEPETGYLVAYQPYALESENIDLEAVVLGPELGKATEDLENDRLAVIFSIPIPNAEEMNDDGIG